MGLALGEYKERLPGSKRGLNSDRTSISLLFFFDCHFCLYSSVLSLTSIHSFDPIAKMVRITFAAVLACKFPQLSPMG